MVTMVTLSFVLVVVGFVTTISLLVNLLNRNHAAIRALYALVEKHEHDRLYAKCSGLFSRLLREFHKKGLNVWCRRQEYNVLELSLGKAQINIAVKEDRGAFEIGQLIAYEKGRPTIHSCEEDIRTFTEEIYLILTEKLQSQ